MGSYLYLWGGFKCPFLVVGITLIGLMFILILVIPSEIAVDDKVTSENANRLEEEASKRSGFWYLLKNFVTTFT